MPAAALRPCARPGCRQLTQRKWCDRHTTEPRGYERARGSAHARGYNSKWRKARTAYLAEHPLCVECLKVDITEPATEVDHIVPHRGDQKLFWNRRNWQGLCKPHHSSKTARGQ